MSTNTFEIDAVDDPYGHSNANERDESLMLMSMALDGLLDPNEMARLDVMMAADNELAATWEQWCKVDEAFSLAPVVLPERGFTNRFEARLEDKMARQRLRQRILVGSVATVFLVLLLITAGAALWLVVANQSDVMGSFVRESAYYGRAIEVGIGALRSTVLATFSEPQSAALAAAYALATGALLYVWWRILRRWSQNAAEDNRQEEIAS